MFSLPALVKIFGYENPSVYPQEHISSVIFKVNGTETHGILLHCSIEKSFCFLHLLVSEVGFRSRRKCMSHNCCVEHRNNNSFKSLLSCVYPSIEMLKLVVRLRITTPVAIGDISLIATIIIFVDTAK